MKYIVYWLFFLVLASSNLLAGEKKNVDLQKRDQKISHEIEQKGSDHEWAGIYTRGSIFTGQTGYLALAPKNGFVFHAAASCGSAMSQSYGKVQQKGDMLILSPPLNDKRNQELCLDSNLFIVTWGKTRYLIEEKDLVRFCNAVNSGLEYPFPFRLSTFFTWSGSDKKNVDRLPVMPKKYQRFILTKPIYTRIVSFKQNAPLIVTLDIGGNHGVFLGMELYPTEGIRASKGAFKIIITGIDKAACQAKIIKFSNSKPTIQIGQELSTVLISKRFNVESNKASPTTLQGYKRTEF